MIKFFTVLVVLALATTVHSQGDSGSDNTNRPVLYENLKGTIIDDLVTLACGIKDVLSDREVSDHIYKIFDGLLQNVVKKGLACMKPIVFRALNNHSSAIGKAVTIFRLGRQGEITDLSDIFSGIPQGPLLLPFLFFGGFQVMFQQIDHQGVDREMGSIWKQIEEQCHTQEYDELRANVEFVIKRFDEKFKAAKA